MALLKTLTNQKAMRSSLLDRRDQLSSKIQSLQAAIVKLDANIRDKDVCIRIDSKALMMDGRSDIARPPSRASLAFSSTGSAAPSHGAGGSGRSSTRQSIMSRLSQLEDDLRKTRESNEALERSIRDYSG